MIEFNRPINFSRFHRLEPDYSSSPYRLKEKLKSKILDKLASLYGKRKAEKYFPYLHRVIKVYYAYKTEDMRHWEKYFQPSERFTQEDAILITYGDLICADGEKPLHTLSELSEKYLKGVFNILHILPFFPSTSDRGFAIKDFTEVDPHLGDWEDIVDLKKNFKLMFDGVFNHVSSKSKWFQEFLNQNPNYLDFFSVFSTTDKIPPEYLSMIVRPRTTNLLTPFNTLNGQKYVWTTFSEDQIDLNFSNPEVLIKMVEILLLYVRKGADIIRLDAVTYLWDEFGTPGIHLKQTHTIIQLFRIILDAVAPHVALITETNVPHAENLTYFGNGYDEAQMVYNFALPPLVLHTFQTEDATKLTRWAMELKKISPVATYFNFLDSHDGVGVMAAKNILSDEEIENMALHVIENGGFISYKREADGRSTPYELNITWYSAINKEQKNESEDLQVRRYIASRVVALVLQGIPGIYLHGLLGSRNDAEAVIEEEQTRSINRKRIRKNELIWALLDPNTTTYKVVYRLASLLMKRKKETAFHPNAKQKVLEVSSDFFVVLRTSQDNNVNILTIVNVTAKDQIFSIRNDMLELNAKHWYELIDKRNYRFDKDKMVLEIEPYGLRWLRSGSQ